MPTATLAPPTTLGALIRSVLESTDLLTPDAVADEVARLTPEGSLREFYRQALRERVRATMQMSAAHSMSVSAEDAAEENSSSGQIMSEAHRLPAGRGAKQKPVKSAKFALINAAHQKRLRERFYVDGEWKMLGDFTRSDLLLAAEARDEVAAKAAANAEKMRRIEKEMTNRGAVKVSELPADVLDAAYQG